MCAQVVRRALDQLGVKAVDLPTGAALFIQNCKFKEGLAAGVLAEDLLAQQQLQHPIGELEWKRDYESSAFKDAYDQTAVLEHQHELFKAVFELIQATCKRNNVPKQEQEAFFKELQKKAFSDDERRDELLSNVQLAAQRLWTSAATLTLPTTGANFTKSELCTILNQAIREDVPAMMEHTAVIARAIDTLCQDDGSLLPEFPSDGICWRGGGFSSDPKDKVLFTKLEGTGEKYRVPGFLATSFKESVAQNFLKRAVAAGRPGVLWRIHLDPRGKHDPTYRCKNVNLVKSTEVGGEHEYLFGVYSAFKVRRAKWGAGTVADPHVIDLDAMLDSRNEDTTVHLAPWC